MNYTRNINQLKQIFYLKVRPNDDMRTIPIDNIPREIRFYDDKAVILMAADDPRLLGFEPGIRSVFIDNMTIDCPVDGDYVDFLLDGQIHKVKIGAPTRELYIDGKWYELQPKFAQLFESFSIAA